MDPVIVECSSACTVTLELSIPPFNLGVDDAALISSAVLLVWAVGYACRMLIRALDVDGKPSTSESEN